MAAKKSPRAEKAKVAKVAKKAAKAGSPSHDVKHDSKHDTKKDSSKAAKAPAQASKKAVPPSKSGKAKTAARTTDGASAPAMAKSAAVKSSKAKKAPGKDAVVAAPKKGASRSAVSGSRVTRKAATAEAKPTGRARKASRRHSELTPKISAKLRQKLLEKHHDLVGAVTSTKGGSREQATDGTEDYIDYAVSSYDREFLLSLTELEQRELKRVEEALRRMDRGEYGFCQASGEEIPLKRLEAQPWARYSLRVQELEDQGLLNQDDFDGPNDGDEDAEEPEFEELDDEDETEEEEGELEYRDEIPADDNLSDPDAEERVV